MATTTNYSWTTPDDTDLVKDGAAAIRTLGSSADTTVKDLNPGTTAGDIDYYTSSTAKARVAIGTAGQVLKVNAGGTAPEWATTADQTPLTTKGDLFTFDTADARLGVGANGTILTADSAETTGLKWAAPASGGGLTLLDSGTLSGSSVTSASLDQSYTNLTIIVSDFLPATDSARLRIRPNGVSAASSYTQGNQSGSATLSFDSSYIGVTINADNAVSKNLTMITIPDYANTTTYKIVQSTSATVNDATPANVSMYNFIVGVTAATSAITTMNFFPSSGNFTSGDYYIYGS
jgi:hypothetical protein